eukprot:TRINITY_DN2511_c0_g1_i1.p1 TRINITY_DN2511_c0_g1~~TRINITY_DN2511_c0_g1_i1.p1  ORF type:complete len:546 (-),score=131.93 TRINITY_DN2511_c0_g1_i1:220-1857(-)
MELEHSLMKVPYELLAKELRQSQKLIEKELQQTTQAVNNLSLKAGGMSEEKICETLDGIVGRLKGLKRKLEDAKQKEEEQLRRAKARLDHLSEAPSVNAYGMVTSESFRKQRMLRLVVDYLLRNGYYQSAMAIVQTHHLELICDTDAFLKGKIVEEGLKNKDCTEALRWCFENRYKLRKIKSTLELNLRIQEFIEYVRQGDLKTAISYARKHLANAATSNADIAKIQRAMGTLAFRRDSGSTPYKQLFDDHQWKELITQFKNDLCLIHGLPLESAFYVHLGCGLASLKTHQCYQTDIYPPPPAPTPVSTSSPAARRHSIASASPLPTPFSLSTNTAHTAPASSSILSSLLPATGTVSALTMSSLLPPSSSSSPLTLSSSSSASGPPPPSSSSIPVSLGSFTSASSRTMRGLRLILSARARTSESESEREADNSMTSPPPTVNSSTAANNAIALPHHPARKCPICHPLLKELARALPFSHHVNSSLMCSLTGRVMDEDNFPYVLPNGHVYSRIAIEEIMTKNDGKVVCPKTGAVFSFSQLKKAFIS